MENIEWVVLVDESGKTTGKEEKIKAHKDGLLHKAFSIVLFNDAGEMLLQQRAFDKYHTPGLWTNACCSHPRPDENLEAAAHRRLMEELGIDTAIEEKFSFVYKFLDEPTQLWEHEHDTVFVGQYNADISEIPFNKDEVNVVKWVTLEELQKWIALEPEVFTFWFKTFLPKLIN